MSEQDDNTVERVDLADLKRFRGMEEAVPGFVPDAVSQVLEIHHWLLVGRLVWPMLVEYRGGIFVDIQFDRETVDEWLADDRARHEVERFVNHLHIWDLVGDPDVEQYDPRCREIADLLAKSWQCRADREFPDIDVEAETEETSYGPAVYLWSPAS
jgi:hypothetical protein